MDDAETTSSGSSSENLAATGIARLPIVDSVKNGTTRGLVAAETTECRQNVHDTPQNVGDIINNPQLRYTLS